MSYESITDFETIADLNSEWPSASVSLNEIHFHIKAIKRAWQYTFPNVSATVSGNAAEFMLAHKGGTISGNCNIKGFSLSVNAELVVKGAVNCSNFFERSGDSSQFLQAADYAHSANFAHSGSNAEKTQGLDWYGAFIWESATLSSRFSEAPLFSATHLATGVYVLSHHRGSDLNIIATAWPYSTGLLAELPLVVSVGDQADATTLTIRTSLQTLRNPRYMVVMAGGALT